jgi:hypothetical protein
MIRFILGFLIVFGAVGGMENGTDAQLPMQIIAAIFGLICVYFGALKLQKNEDNSTRR